MLRSNASGSRCSAMRLDSWQPEEETAKLSPPVNQIRGHIEAHKDTVFRALNTVAQGGRAKGPSAVRHPNGRLKRPGVALVIGGRPKATTEFRGHVLIFIADER